MKITAVKKQQRRGRYSIFVDERYCFSLSETALLQHGIVPGQELTQQRIVALKKLSNEDKAYEKALNYVLLRPHSEWEITSYLKRKNLNPRLVDSIVKTLTQKHYIDDIKFTRSWVENRRLLKPTSRRRLEQELKQKRVSEDIIRQALSEDETSDRSTLLEIIERKRRQTKYQDKQILMRYLLRQGFNYSDVKSALDSS